MFFTSYSLFDVRCFVHQVNVNDMHLLYLNDENKVTKSFFRLLTSKFSFAFYCYRVIEVLRFIISSMLEI